MNSTAVHGEKLEAYIQYRVNVSFARFVDRMSPADHKYIWFHREIMQKLQDVYDGKIRRLMLFVPPQHGKSTLASRLFPSWCLGRNPKTKIVGSSYSADLAQSFSRDIQRIIDDPLYHSFFPNTYLNNSNVRSDSRSGYLRNADIFETVGQGGYYKSVGVCGSLTGTAADIAIIDDPVKDAIEAYSQTYRERVWEWYMNVLSTRLHNNSRVILIMTRWHMDDLAGRLLEDMKHGGQPWDVVIFPAIKEGAPTEKDPRQDGEALWSVRHSAEKVLQVKRMSLRVFNSLYQQNPAPEEGSIFKRSWFGRYELADLNKRALDKLTSITWHFRIDTAYTEKQSNDPTGLICYAQWDNNYYIRDWLSIRCEMPALIEAVKAFATRNGYTDASGIKIEPKASGLSLIQMLKAQTGLNVSAAKNPVSDKIARASVVVPMVESGRVYVLNGAGWTEDFLYELTTFPVGKHDEAVDCLVMMLTREATGSDERSIIGLRTIG